MEIFNNEKPLSTPTTENEWSTLFEKFAEQVNPQTYEELQLAVTTTFEKNAAVQSHFERWTTKIARDRNKLKQIFNK